ncbi:hypothetical protein RIR_e44755_A0A2I1FHF7_9GLOM [Rhizophagus irregularis DAOM 181602=DAOM 197198]|uniref:Uncharacterized protein n=1 Tax=Rhizophagus irregularis (strain DAOM 181602 / DAOM 197198 / MUCL 43194) TaxID=747089 RepID=U9U6C6_RHIID|nr:hypothetical protein RhiirB3_452990 [Rhizophagus irregularis]GBC52533.1 hypothetical protein RIR_e44755_A0A2I1FHF7_9GLOM [Rhizophagus irregularis DAOM 181602=DAOM 197198]
MYATLAVLGISLSLSGADHQDVDKLLTKAIDLANCEFPPDFSASVIGSINFSKKIISFLKSWTSSNSSK